MFEGQETLNWYAFALKINDDSMRGHALNRVIARNWAIYQRYMLAAALTGGIGKRNAFCALVTRMTYCVWASTQYPGRGLGIAANPIFGGISGWNSSVNPTHCKSGEWSVDYYTYESSSSNYTETRCKVILPDDWRGAEEEKARWECLSTEVDNEYEKLVAEYGSEISYILPPPPLSVRLA